MNFEDWFVKTFGEEPCADVHLSNLWSRADMMRSDLRKLEYQIREREMYIAKRKAALQAWREKR